MTLDIQDELLARAKRYAKKTGRPLRKVVDEIKAVVGRRLGSDGALGLRGGWGSINDHEVDALIETIYAARRRDTRPPC